MPKNLLKGIVADWLAQAPLVSEFVADGRGAKLASLFSTPPNPELGDFALPMFPLAKSLGKNPAELAVQFEAQCKDLAPNALIAKAIAEGPYLNLSLVANEAAKAVIAEVSKRSCGETPNTWHFGESNVGASRTASIDMSSPNIAKPLAVHHLRSTMIGNSLKKLYEATGWKVVGINHLGDWGTSFGRLIAGFIEERPDIAKNLKASIFEESNAHILMADLTVSDLNQVYVAYSKRCKEHPELAEDGRKEFQALENAMSGMAEAQTTAVITQSFTRGLRNFSIWEQIRRISLEEFEEVYRLLGLRFVDYPITDEKLKAQFDNDRDAFLKAQGLYTGESYYVTSGSECRDVIARSKSEGLAVKSDGALVIYTDGEDKPPLMLLKNDGATSYHTRDMAAAVYRATKFGVSKGVYVVGAEQKLHFKQLFKALQMLGYEWAQESEHVDFGLVLGKNEEGHWKKFSTRAGKVVLLHDLLNEAIEAVAKIIAEKNPELAKDQARLKEISEAVGVGAVVFNDLKHGRKSDVKFDWDEMLSFQGETGPYMHYQYVRLGSVMRRYEETHGEIPEAFDASKLSLEQEKSIALELADFPAVVAKAAAESEPALISRYLLELSHRFASYWNATKDSGIVSDDKALSAARIALVKATRKVLGKGLLLLGLKLVDEM